MSQVPGGGGPLIRIDGMEELLAKIRNLEQLKRVGAAIKAGALHVKGLVARYPPQVPHPPRGSVFTFAWQTKKQKRFFFAALRRGEIEVPYRRGLSPSSKALGRQWSIEQSGDGLTAVVGVSTDVVPYARYVQDRDLQSRYMQALGWRTVQDVAEEANGEVQRMVKDEIEREIAA